MGNVLGTNKDNGGLLPLDNRQSVEGLCRLNDSSCFYAIGLKRDEQGIPRTRLEEIGPRLDCTVSRSFTADKKFRATAFKQPAQLKIHHRKNVEKVWRERSWTESICRERIRVNLLYGRARNGELG
jgi:hypothetical protein